MRRAHWIALDCLAAVPTALVLGVTVFVGDHRSGRALPELLLLAGLASLAAVPVALRRIRPLPAFGTIVAVVVNGETVASLIYDCLNGDRLTAFLGEILEIEGLHDA